VNTRLTCVSLPHTPVILLFRTLSATPLLLSPFSPIACRPLELSCLSFSGPCPLFSMPCSLFFQNAGGGVSPIPQSRIKMTHKSPSSAFTPERCQYRTATGRQCCSPVVDPGSSFCARHAASEPSDFEDFSVALTQKALPLPERSGGLHHSLGALYTLCAQGRISPCRASTLAYISSLLLRPLTAIDNDLYPKAGRAASAPAANPSCKTTSTQPTMQVKARTARTPPNRKSPTDRVIFIAPHEWDT
jgi:hypothetical protein